jgi:hypothetical protein
LRIAEKMTTRKAQSTSPFGTCTQKNSKSFIPMTKKTRYGMKMVNLERLHEIVFANVGLGLNWNKNSEMGDMGNLVKIFFI